MNKKRQTGFTIVELIVTIVIAGFIIPSVAIALNNLAAINHRARDYAIANTIAQNKVETLRSNGYNSLNLGTVNFSSELPSSMGTPKNASYTVSSPVTGEKQIDISISFTEYNATRNLTFRTYVSELGVGQ